jgi:UDP-N-acetylmuramate dehydrogenase
LLIQKNIPLAPLTTFKVGGPARYFVEAASEEAVKAAVAHAAERQWPLFVLGGGSNLVIADEGWPGLVLKVAISGITGSGITQPSLARPTDPGDEVFHVGAGHDWDSFVAYTVREGYAGIECLSGIPGTVGGTPVQNVGAYGQEVADTIRQVRVLEIATGQIKELSNIDCGFAYRSSIFNSTQRGRYIVLQVTYRLMKNGAPRIEYADLKKHFSGLGGTPSLQQVRDAVRGVRQSKAMLIVEGDDDCRSAGSFFKNPVVGFEEADRIKVLAHELAPGKDLPQYPGENGKIKISAAWLVEQAGIHKGYGRGPVGTSRKHALAIVNKGGARARDIMALKNEIQQRVVNIWGVRLDPEPVFVGFSEEM